MLPGEVLFNILADFRNLLPGEVLFNLLADFSIIESNKLSINATLSSNYKISNGILGLFYKGYMPYNYGETRVSHTKYIGTLWVYISISSSPSSTNCSLPSGMVFKLVERDVI